MSTIKVNTLTTLDGTGNITVSRPLSGSGASLTSLPAANLTGTISAISGANLTNLNATNLGSGTLPDARFPATLPAASGVNLTALNASNLGSGTVPTARLGTGTADSSVHLRGDGTWAAAGGGKVLRVLASTSTYSPTTVSTTNNTWTDSTVAYTLTPLSSSSKFLVYFGMPVTKYDLSGDGGYGFRVKRSQSSVITYPAGLNHYSGANVHSSFYMNPGFTNSIFEYRTWMGFDDTTQNGTSMTYTIQAAQYNLNYMNVGLTYNSIPRIIIQEIGT